MTKKHFKALADAIHEHNQQWSDHFTATQLHSLARFCAQQNPAFDRQGWFQYLINKEEEAKAKA